MFWMLYSNEVAIRITYCFAKDPVIEMKLHQQCCKSWGQKFYLSVCGGVFRSGH